MNKKRVNTVQELAELYKNGKLKEEEDDMVIFDKGRCELYTEKEYFFSMDYGDLAWQYLQSLDIYTVDA